MEQWVEEFLYRGRPPSGPDSDKSPAFHVIVGQQADSPFNPAEKQRRLLPPMSATEAEAAGWTLEVISAAINAETVKALDTSEARAVALETDVRASEAACGELTTALAASEAHVAAITSELETAKLRISELEAEVMVLSGG